MGVVIRQSFISSIITYLGVAIGYFNVLWLYPKFFTNLDEIGLFRVIVDTAILLVPFAQMGLSTTLVKFYPQFNHKSKNLQTFLNTFLLAGFMSFCIFAILFFFFQPLLRTYFIQNSPQVIPYFKIMLALIFMLTITGILEAYSRSMLNIIFPNFLKDVLIRVLSSIIVSLYFLKFLDLDGLMLSLVGIYGISLLILFSYLVFIKQIAFTFDFTIFNKRLVKKILNFCLFAILSGGSGLIVMKIDSIMVAGLIGLDKNAVYTLAFFIATVIEMPRRSISQIMSPLVASNFKDNKLIEIKSLYRKSSNNLFIIGTLLFIGIISNLDSLYFLIPKWQEFAPGKIVVYIIGTAKIFDMVTGINSEIIVMSKYYRFNIIAITILAILTIILNLVLIPKYGLAGAALASLISVVIFNLVKLVFIKVKYNMFPMTVNTLKVLFLGASIYFLSLFIPRMGIPILDIGIKSVAILLVYGFCIIKLNISDEANRLFEQILQVLKIKRS